MTSAARRLVEHHRRRNARDLRDSPRDGASRIDQLREPIDDFVATNLDGRDLDDAAVGGTGARGFGVGDDERRVTNQHPNPSPTHIAHIMAAT
jgi:hypothetical protein